MSNNTELREIISEYGLTRREAATIMMVDTSTVDRYLVPEKKGRSRNPTYINMPPVRLKLLVDGMRGRKKVAE